jgi:CubicO group peptidase (beta-lactamase class C family)
MSGMMSLRNYAAPHDAEGKPSAKRKRSATTAARYGAAGGVQTTTTDLAKFLIEVIKPKASDAFRLSNDSLAEMQNQRLDFAGAGLADTIHGERRLHHARGGNPGFAAFVVASVPRKSGLVIMTNGDNGHLVIDKLLLGEILHQFLGARMPYPRVLGIAHCNLAPLPTTDR